ncbi:MAG: exodeoxyribonuclease VII large subunit [Rudaea sp.]
MPDFIADNVAERHVFSPSLLVRQARDLLEGHFPLLWIEGEISNFSRPSSGHFYFSLKDAGAQIRCAMFKPKSTFLRFKPADGTRVLARARVGLYEARGEFQLIVEHMEESGEGALLRLLQDLKTRLAAEGLFDTALKRALPRAPRLIGVITSPTGAAIRDVLSVIARRYPLVDVEILPVPVQGREAAPAIIAMLAAASAAGRHDVLLLTRGGGSLEDLWSFNDEALARAIRASAIPVVSAVGHEIDFTIADFVADLRAATPSAAAELLVPDILAIHNGLRHQRHRLEQSMRRALVTAIQRADNAYARLLTRHPQIRLRDGRQRLTQLHARLWRQRPLATLSRRRDQLSRLRQNLRQSAAVTFRRRGAKLDELRRALNAVSPLATLQRGYAILFDVDSGRIVRSVVDANTTSRFVARLADGEVKLLRDTEH